MYTPIIRTKQNELPILKREEIDDIAEQFLMDFQPEALRNPMEVDVDGFLERYLGATPDYQYLSHNMIYLGGGQGADLYAEFRLLDCIQNKFCGLRNFYPFKGGKSCNETDVLFGCIYEKIFSCFKNK